MINIFEYHFIVTKGNMYRDDLILDKYTIIANNDRCAWLIVSSMAHDNINNKEHIEKIELIVVE